MFHFSKAGLKHAIVRYLVKREDYSVDHAFEQGYFEEVSIEPSSVIQLTGWHKKTSLAEITPPECFLDDIPILIIDVFRTHRADIADAFSLDDYFCGVVIRYWLDEPISRDQVELRLVFEGKTIFSLTKPDMSAIPMLYPYNVVPWHLLESIHLNFFTQNSLEATLRRYFSSVKFARVGPVETINTRWFVSLVGVCQK